MDLGSVLGLVFVLCFALAFWEYQVIPNLAPSARRAGLRVLLSHGVLPAKHSGILTAPSGFRLRDLGSGAYLIRTAEWHERGPGAGALTPWAVALVRVREREWTLEARFGIGTALLFGAAAATLVTIAARGQFTRVGWMATLAWGAFVVLTFLVQRRRVRRVFEKFAASLGSIDGV
jgi:hypothetical protein